MVDLGKLTEQEAMILYTVDATGGRIEEHALHMMLSIAERAMIADGQGKEVFGDFEVASLYDRLGEGYQTGTGTQSYSPKLHETVDTLVRKKILLRDVNKPIALELNMQGISNSN